MEKIYTQKAPKPAGHYSQAVVHDGIVYVSGQLAIVPGTGEKILGPIEEQTGQVLLNMKEILESAGSGIEHVLKVTVYVSDIAHWDKVNEVYAGFFGSHKPARAVVPVKELHFGFMVEMDCIAVVPRGE